MAAIMFAAAIATLQGGRLPRSRTALRAPQGHVRREIQPTRVDPPRRDATPAAETGDLRKLEAPSRVREAMFIAIAVPADGGS
jgi:hypothetical protein